MADPRLRQDLLDELARLIAEEVREQLKRAAEPQPAASAPARSSSEERV